jgi:hypothetical protein
MFPRELVPFLKENSLFFGEVGFFSMGNNHVPEEKKLKPFFFARNNYVNYVLREKELMSSRRAIYAFFCP